ncbi:hypothetical protein LUR56_06275 [Streptomyces sp. MT29]|nr:hypothetical protein [Streptomyces sp. MT29]
MSGTSRWRPSPRPRACTPRPCAATSTARIELLLELAEYGWHEWSVLLTARLADARDLTPEQTADAVAGTLAAQPLFCDLLTHVPLSLEGDVGIERARRVRTSSFTSYDAIVDTLTGAGTMTGAQVHDLITVALGLTADLWPGRVP